MERVNKILVIPDVHGRDFWEAAVNAFKDDVDKIVFTGDYHDPYEDEGITREKSIENFEKILTFFEANKDKTVMLIGNHDLHYLFSIRMGTSRFDRENYQRLYEMFNEYENDFRIAYEAEIGNKKYLFSHAGFMKEWYDIYAEDIGEPTVENLNKLIKTSEGVNALCAVSHYRGSFDNTGSIIWSDVRERFNKDDSQVEGWYQVFGHTQLRQPIVLEDWACIDCRRAFIIDSEGFKEV